MCLPALQVMEVFRDFEGRDMTEQELEIFFKGLDADRNGLIDWTEFLTGVFCFALVLLCCCCFVVAGAVALLLLLYCVFFFFLLV